MRVAILGVGAIGSLFAAAFAKTDVDLILYSRGSQSAALASTGIILTTIDGDVEHHQPDRWVVSDLEIIEPL